MKTEFELNENEALNKTDVSGSVILPTHLRIGNLILDKDNEFLEVNIITNVSVHSKSKKYDFCGSPLDWCEPIPISENLLLKLGAINLEYKGFPSYNLKGMQINFVNDIWIEYVSRVELTGLHWLQNMFFFRMNEELCVTGLTDR